MLLSFAIHIKINEHPPFRIGNERMGILTDQPIVRLVNCSTHCRNQITFYSPEIGRALCGLSETSRNRLVSRSVKS